MNKTYPIILRVLFFVATAGVLQGCLKDKITRTFPINIPVLESLTQYRKNIKSESPKDIVSAGKLTAFGHYLFLSAPGLGIHVIDNSNPAVPKNVSFINIPGNNDMAIQGNTLYVDAYGDLVTFDISDPAHAIAENFETNVFQDNSIYFRGLPAYSGAPTNPDSVTVVASWITKDTTVPYDPSNPIYQPLAFTANGCTACANSVAPGSGSTGTNGSTARFSIINNYLYTVGYSTLSTFDVTQRAQPAFTNTVQVDFHVETIYPFRNNLFVGTNNGVYMYDVLSTPATPTLLGEFTHLRGCDPVIADSNYAYVTINDSSACLGFDNQLQIVNIQNLNQPFLVKTYQLIHPQGLSKDGRYLFICDGRGGLKIYDASDVSNLQLVKQLNDTSPIDVIAANGLAIVVGTNGLYQYDYSNINDIHLVSKL